jgi:hypothetical protein
MKNLLILIVAVAVFLHFYPQPEVTQFYETTIADLQEGFSDFSDTSVRLDTAKVRADLEPKLKSFTKKEVKQLDILIDDRKKLRTFYYDFCKENKRSHRFQAQNQKDLCRTISKYSKYLRKQQS